MMPKKASKVVLRIIKDLKDRKGLGDTWYSIDEDIKDEIINTWISIVEEY